PEPSAVNGVLGRRAAGVSLADGLKAARTLRALHFIAVRLDRDRDSIVLRAAAYDARSDTAERAGRASLSLPLRDRGRLIAWRQLVNGILRTGTELPWRSATDRGTPSIVAWRSYDAAQAALHSWR